MSIPNFTLGASCIGVGTVWRGIGASGGWRCLPSLGETQCRRKAWPYGGVRQLGRVRGQAQGRHIWESDGTGGTWSGWTRSNRHPFEYRHPVDEAWPGLGGALRGRSPRTREGRIGPTAQNCSGQWSEEALHLLQGRKRTGHGFVATRGTGKITPILGCTLSLLIPIG